MDDNKEKNTEQAPPAKEVNRLGVSPAASVFAVIIAAVLIIGFTWAIFTTT